VGHGLCGCCVVDKRVRARSSSSSEDTITLCHWSVTIFKIPDKIEVLIKAVGISSNRVTESHNVPPFGILVDNGPQIPLYDMVIGGIRIRESILHHVFDAGLAGEDCIHSGNQRPGASDVPSCVMTCDYLCPSYTRNIGSGCGKLIEPMGQVVEFERKAG
jgi:hypothetical protein